MLILGMLTKKRRGYSNEKKTKLKETGICGRPKSMKSEVYLHVKYCCHPAVLFSSVSHTKISVYMQKHQLILSARSAPVKYGHCFQG